MRLQNWILRFLGYRPRPRLAFPAEAALIQSLNALAEREQVDPEQLAADLLAAELQQRLSYDENVERWNALSPREQQVVALACLGHSVKESALALKVSRNTIKTQRRNALRKFDAPDQQALCKRLAGWDFTDFGF